MDLNARFHNVAVVGAAGKMGSGISLLLARELTFRALEDPSGSYTLNLIDLNEAMLEGLLRYLQEHGAREAEKHMDRLRRVCGAEDAVQVFVREMMARIRTGTSLPLAQDARMVFEAAFENEALKIRIYRELAALCSSETYFFSNTSSIPLRVMSEASGLQGRLIGFHFYNPSAVQKLIELITPSDCREDLKALSLEIAETMGKIVVPSNDIAGFIGNGHLMRDGLHAIAEVERLAPEHGFHQSVFMVDRVSRDWLLRPMGIFQLMDYVGLDVFQLILNVMNKHLDEHLHSDLIDRLVARGLKGGETLDGAQRDGFFHYEKTRPIAVMNPDTGDYVSLERPWAQEALARLGEHPEPALNWKALKGDPERETKLRTYFAKFKAWPSLGADLALRHLRADRERALRLVEQGVAVRAEDVNRVLQMGFMHLYGPVLDYLFESERCASEAGISRS